MDSNKITRQKHTFESMKENVEKKGYKLLEEKYEGVDVKIHVVCPKGHDMVSSYKRIMRGDQCAICAGVQKYSIEDVKNYFAKFGYTLLSTEYHNNKEPMEIMCPKGHVNKMGFKNFKNGARCMDCSGKKKHSFEFIRSEFEKRGYKLLAKFYKDKDTPMEYICQNGHEAKISYGNLKQGSGCKRCACKQAMAQRSGPNNNLWNPNRELVLLNRKIHIKCKSLIRNTLVRIGQTKTSKSEDTLGYTREQLKNHLVSQEKWNDGDCHIDHIFPVAAFVRRGITDMKIINHLTNLQCLSSEENLSKSDVYDEKAFEAWLATVI